MTRLFNYISRLGRWLWESFQIMIVIIPSLLILGFSEEIGRETIELCGGIMQVVGTVYGVMLFVKIRDSLSFPSLKDLFVDWINRFPRWRKDVRVLAGATVASTSLVSGKASIWSHDDSSLSVEERIKRIIRNQDELRKSLEDAELTISSLRIELISKIESQDGNFQSEIKQVTSILESIHMEDFLWALTGLLFILAGTLFTNFASYLA